MGKGSIDNEREGTIHTFPDKIPSSNFWNASHSALQSQKPTVTKFANIIEDQKVTHVTGNGVIIHLRKGHPWNPTIVEDGGMANLPT